MFPREARFPPTKVSDVPGPNSYSVNPDSQLDSYKHGAFLEKTDRFAEAKLSDVPRPGSYPQSDHGSNDKQPAKRVVSATSERYSTLQHQLEELERMYAESRKTHKAEVERLKQELSRGQKLNSEQTSQIDKLKKQNDSLDARLQESQKQNLVDQAEIKELRAKLRVSENERGHLASKSEESGDAKKSLAVLEAKRKEELRERDRRVADLEKSIAEGQRRNEALERKFLESKGRTQQELDEARKKILGLQKKVSVAEEGVASARTGAGQREEELITQLESARSMIQQVAKEYGGLASSSVSKANYDTVERENYYLRLNANRLQRKFAIADSEANETVDLLKVSREQNRALEHILRGAWADLGSHADALSDALPTVDNTPSNEDAELESHLARVALDESTRRTEAISAQLSSVKLFSHWYKTLGRTLLHDYSLACSELSAAAEENQAYQSTITVATTHVSTLSTQVEAAKLQTESVQRQAAELSEKLEVAKNKEASLKEEMVQRERDVKAEKQVAKERLEREKEMVKHLQTTMERQRFAEDEMRNEVITLSKVVAESEDYAHAYQALLDEVNALVDRNSLAEEEAQKLSKFNAQLLSHKNPAQKILYVDRIRQELADTKQQLLLVMRERDNVLTSNETLQKELGMYTAVTVPTREKPRTTMTRVTRMPLSSINP